MPEAMKPVGLFTFTAWAIDGYTKVFWRNEPVSHLAPQVAARNQVANPPRAARLPHEALFSLDRAHALLYWLQFGDLYA